MRIAFVGSRDYPKPEDVQPYIECLDPTRHTIISGGARGIDRTAAQKGRARGIYVIEYLPDWNRGKSAGMERNTDIVNNCDILIAFWDGHSRGTQDSIHKAQKNHVPGLVVYNNGRVMNLKHESVDNPLLYWKRMLYPDKLRSVWTVNEIVNQERLSTLIATVVLDEALKCIQNQVKIYQQHLEQVQMPIFQVCEWAGSAIISVRYFDSNGSEIIDPPLDLKFFKEIPLDLLSGRSDEN